MLSRLGAIAMVLCFVALTLAIPERYRIAPGWLIYGDAAFFIALMIAAMVGKPGSFWRRAERPAGLAAVALAFAINTTRLAQIANRLMFAPQSLKPLALFHASVSLWFANIVIFTIAYWLIDSGDFDFPARSDPSKLGPNWRPSILDYLFIAFTTNTAFGPTEAMPLTARAKSLVLIQSLVSLVTVAGVAARAIGATSD